MRAFRSAVACLAASLLLATPGLQPQMAGTEGARIAKGRQGGAARARWQLPARAFVEYLRQRTKFRVAGGDSRLLYPGPDPAPGFYEWEVTDGRTVSFRTSSLVDVMVQLALSLSGTTPRDRSRLKVNRDFHHVHKFGSVRAVGSMSTDDASDPRAVRESGRFELTRFEGEFPPLVEKQWPSNLLRGTFELSNTWVDVSRVVDSIDGRVATFTVSMKGAFQDLSRREETKVYDFEVAEEWVFDAIREPYYLGFQTRVDKAIADGCRYLERNLGPRFDRADLRGDVENERSYGTGRLALVLLTLVKGNPDRESKPIPQLVDELRRRKPIDTYSLGMSLMAMEAYYSPPNEAIQFRQGLIDRPAPRVVSEPDRNVMREWVDQLLTNYDTRPDKGYLFRFNYVQGARFDNSVTQYGVLGLYSAALCGIEVPFTIWLGLADHYLQIQCPEEAVGVRLVLPTYATVEREKQARETGGTTARARTRATDVRGYSYAGATHPTGSMTCAGLAGLGIVQSMLATGGGRGKARAPRKTMNDLERALQAAFAWTYLNYDVRSNPRHDRDWYYYYIFGLERACEINGVARIHDRDWYFDGAMQLLATQDPNGSWNGLVDSCFAILFLKKAVAPVVTGR